MKQVCSRMNIAKIAGISQVICSSILNNWWDKKLEIFRYKKVSIIFPVELYKNIIWVSVLE